MILTAYKVARCRIGVAHCRFMFNVGVPIVAIAYTCMLISILMPFVWVLSAKATIRYNNHAPRAQLEKLEGWQARAHWAHLNSIEALPGFLAAVIVAIQTGTPASTVNALAVSFVVARIIYGLCYIRDLATLRSIVWFAGLACVIALFVCAIHH